MSARPFLCIFLVTFFWVAQHTASAQSVVINEVMVLNDSVLPDQDNSFHPWVELLNRGNNPQNLQQFYLSNDPHHPKKWKLPNVQLPPDSLLIVFLSGESINSAPPYHANFSVQNVVHQVYLSNAYGDLIDVTPQQCIPTNRSLGRLPDGFSEWALLSTSSPESTNNIAWADNFSDQQISLQASHPSGYYTGNVQLELAVDNNYDIHYTLNTGAAPTHLSSQLNSSILLSARKNDPNQFSTIQTTELASAFYEPEQPINKANVIRAVAYHDGCPVSEVFTGNYLIDPSGYQYPADVVFVNTAPDNLFDSDNGIYVFGDHHNYTQRGELWEHPAHVEFMNKEGEVYLGQNAGIRIHGGGTREGAQKSLRLYAREEYGSSTFNYPFFEDRELTHYKRLLLRMSMGDWSRTLFKDHLSHHLVRDLNIAYQSGRAAVVFLNGEYWGVHNIRERQDKHYVESHYGVDDDNLDMIEYNIIYDGPNVDEGDLQNYENLIQFVQQNDLSLDVNYEQIAEKIDIPNFIDQHIAQLYFANTDYPENNNAFWRSRSTSGVWRWLFFDCDACMRYPQYNHLFDYLGEDEIHNERPDWSMVLLRGLMRNKQFQTQFSSRFRTLLNTTFSPATVIATIEEFVAMYGPLVPEHIARWNYPKSFHEWQENVHGLKLFAMDRPVLMNELLTKYFGQPYVIYPNPSSGPFTVQFIGEAEVGSVELYNGRGEMVFETHFGNSLFEEIEIAESLVTGIYLLRVEADNNFYSQRIVIGAR